MIASPAGEITYHRPPFRPPPGRATTAPVGRRRPEAPSRELVAEANRRAQIPYERIHEAAEMTPDAI